MNAIGQDCPQFGNSIPLPTPPNTVPVPGSADSEDCLFLNIYVPADRYDDGGEPLPVLFWNHGGSNEYGEGSTYDPTPLVNYRLGALGWLAHPLLDDGTPNSSGNYGLMGSARAPSGIPASTEAIAFISHIEAHACAKGVEFSREAGRLA